MDTNTTSSDAAFGDNREKTEQERPAGYSPQKPIARPNFGSEMSDATGPMPSKIGFPPGMIGENPLRLDILKAERNVYAAIDKPADILLDSYLGSPKNKSVMLALREQKGKPELERLGMKSPYAVNQIDFEYSGAGLIAMDKEIATAMRNAMWSGFFRFEFILFCKAVANIDENFKMELPVLMHEERPVWLISHRFGKKASTSFEILASSNGYQLWKAEASTARPHQIRLHAAEGGLRIVGEWIYSKTPYFFLSDIKEEYRLGKGKEEKAFYPHLGVHLSKISFNGADCGIPELGKVEINAPIPKGISTCMKKLGLNLP